MEFQINEAALRQDLAERRQKIREQMNTCGVDAVLLTAPANLFYATGRVLIGYFYLPLEGDPILFDMGRGPLAADAVAIRKPEAIPALLPSASATLALETVDIGADEYLRLQAVFAGSRLADATALLRAARAVKTDHEIEIMRANGRCQAAFYDKIPALYRPGMSDLEFSAALEQQVRLDGSIGLFRTFGFRMEAYMSSVLAGDNGCVPSPYDFSLGGAGLSPAYPFGPTGRVMKEGETVLVDMNFNRWGHMTDMSRCYALGEPNAEAQRLHELAIAIHRRLIAMMKPGTLCSELYLTALQMAAEGGAADCFMGTEKQVAFIGHGVGIQINELPVLTKRYEQPLQANMVIAVEPKFIAPGGPVGVENSYAITATGCENLTPGEESLLRLV